MSRPVGPLPAVGEGLIWRCWETFVLDPDAATIIIAADEATLQPETVTSHSNVQDIARRQRLLALMATADRDRLVATAHAFLDQHPTATDEGFAQTTFGLQPSD